VFGKYANKDDEKSAKAFLQLELPASVPAHLRMSLPLMLQMKSRGRRILQREN
jgi:hypothetical protein